jgi:hypothetical protein
MKIFPVVIQLKEASDDHPGHVVPGFYTLDGDTVTLVDEFGDPKTDADGKTYRRKLEKNQDPRTIGYLSFCDHIGMRGRTSHATVLMGLFNIRHLRAGADFTHRRAVIVRPIQDE